jgi:hypothetical protein
MQTAGENSNFTRTVLAEVAQYSHTTEYAVIRELCALYDHFCDCPSVIEQRLYVKRRIVHYKEILTNERNN